VTRCGGPSRSINSIPPLDGRPGHLLVKMLSRSLIRAARAARPQLSGRALPWTQTVRRYAEIMVKVPQMAESISEGTLKQFNFKVGDFINRDDELASIETDKIDVAVSAPESGTVKQLLVGEEDTVTVGQDVAIIDTEGASAEGGKAPSEGEAPVAEATKSEEAKLVPEAESKPAEEEIAATVEKPQPTRQPEPPKKETAKVPAPSHPIAMPQTAGMGSREERRVSALEDDAQ
jgi:2-oxoglutarate dehydrogenase E2 component (dihydrolipoamide succinyltransferase)